MKIDVKVELTRRVQGAVDALRRELLAAGVSEDKFADEIEVIETSVGVEVVFVNEAKPKRRSKAADGTQSDDG